MRLPDLNDLIADLQLAKEIAIRNENSNGLVVATLAQAKLLGIDKGEGMALVQTNIIEHEPKIVYSDEQLKRVLLEIDRKLEEEY